MRLLKFKPKESKEERLREILRKVRRIDIATRKVVQDVFWGEYRSVFRGRGMDFSEVREYQPGDERLEMDIQEPLLFVVEQEIKDVEGYFGSFSKLPGKNIYFLFAISKDKGIARKRQAQEMLLSKCSSAQGKYLSTGSAQSFTQKDGHSQFYQPSVDR